jgi:hypothetical protein
LGLVKLPYVGGAGQNVGQADPRRSRSGVSGDNDKTSGRVAAAILHSDEYRLVVVDKAIAQFLDRAPGHQNDGGGVTLLRAGNTNEMYYAGVIGDTIENEFFNKTAS